MKRLHTLTAFLLCLALLLPMAACARDEEPSILLDPVADPGAGMSETYGTVEVTASKDALNPLTGRCDMPADRVGIRPIAVSVNNIHQCWPQYGISQADYILEMETEGGITRLMCLFSDTREIELIGSVRSLRDQFMEMIYPLDPIIVHIGTSIFADRAISEHNMHTLDGEFFGEAMWFDRDRYNSGYAWEHCTFTSGKLIEDSLSAAKLDPKGGSRETAFNFVDEPDAYTPGGGAAETVAWDFSDSGDGDFRYDAASGLYYKWQYGEKQMDAGANEQLAFENVFVLFGDIEVIDEYSQIVHVNYQAGGEGYYFSRGGWVHVTWHKGDYSSPMTLRTDDGAELRVNPGKSYFSIVRDANRDTLSIR